jgi:uncharacterized protein
MRITLDTNILISATFWRGESDTIIRKAESGKVELILSREILQEYVEVLDYKEIKNKIRDKKLDMQRTAEKIASISTIVSPKEKISIIKNDPSDNKILECAKAGHVKFIITNDKHLLTLNEFEGIKIVTPKEFLENRL